MNVNKIIIVVLLASLSSVAQEKEKYFLLDKNNPEYFYFLNGKMNGSPENSNNLVFFIISREKYEQYLSEKDNIIVVGETLGISGLSFIATNHKTIKNCEFKKLDIIDFKWLEENERIKTKDYIELNNFENLKIVLKIKNHYVSYEILRKFTPN